MQTHIHTSLYLAGRHVQDVDWDRCGARRPLSYHMHSGKARGHAVPKSVTSQYFNLSFSLSVTYTNIEQTAFINIYSF